MIDLTVLDALRLPAPETSRAAAPEDALAFRKSLETLRGAETPRTERPSVRAEKPEEPGDAEPTPVADADAAAEVAEPEAPDAEAPDSEGEPDIPPGSGMGDLASLFFAMHGSPPPSADTVQATGGDAALLDGAPALQEEAPLEIGLPQAGPAAGGFGAAAASPLTGTAVDLAPQAQPTSPETLLAAAAAVPPTPSGNVPATNTPSGPEAASPSNPAAQPDGAAASTTQLQPTAGPAGPVSRADADMPPEQRSGTDAATERPEPERTAAQPDGGTVSAAQLPPAPGAADGPRQAEAPRDVRPPVPPQPPAHIVVREGSYDNLGLHVAHSSRNSEEKTIVRLDPPRLGTVELTLETRGEVTRVVLVADRPEALEMLRRDAQSLEQSLTRAGLKMEGGMEFSLRQDARGSNGGHRDEGRRGQPQPSYGDEDQEFAVPMLQPARSGLEMIV